MREYMQQLFAERIRGASFGLEEKIYKFEKIKQEKRLAIKNNPQAASYALQHPEITEKTVEKYSRRFELLSKGLRECGFQVEKPKGSIYLYTKAPIGLKDGPRFKNAEEFALYLIREHLISTVPWDDVGSYIRFSVTFEAEDERAEEQVVEMVKSRLKKVQFLFEER